jgi:CubicO group peptidase (beta-lactamase class C family)
LGAFAGSQTVVHAAGPISGDSVFQIGSVTPVFTTLALADAVARGELTMDIPLTALLPRTPTPATGAPITLGHLATHTSGLPRLPPGLRRRALRSRADPYRDVTTEYLLDALRRVGALRHRRLRPRRLPGWPPRRLREPTAAA